MKRLPAGPVPRVAVHRLNPRYRDDIASHLLQLPAEDRRLRFGHSIPDDAVRKYVAGIDFGRDSVFGIHGAALTTSVPSSSMLRSSATASPRRTKPSLSLGSSTCPARVSSSPRFKRRNRRWPK